MKFDAGTKTAYEALSDFIIDFLESIAYYDSVIIGIWTDTLGSDVIYGDLGLDEIYFWDDWYEGGTIKVRYIIGLLTIDKLISII